MTRKTLVLPAIAGVVATTLVACGTEQGQPSKSDAIVVGTTDKFAVSGATPAPLDPAAVYDNATWNIFHSTFQTLLRLPRSGTEPEGDAAQSCSFTDTANEQYRCRLRDGLTFSDGAELTARDVEFSVKRVIAIDHPNGPSSLLANIDRVETAGERDVVFHLKESDATFPYKLTTPAAAIVDSRTYPAEKPYEGTDLTGSGPYELDSLDSESGTVALSANSHYEGPLEPRNEHMELRSYPDADKLEQALVDGHVDLANRTLAPEQISRLQQEEGVDVREATSQGIRYLVFNTDKPAVQDKAVRQAVAQLVDRQELVRDVYERTAEPLYSMVPGGLPSHRNTFFDSYGEPDAKAAERILRKAGISEPVELRLTYTNDYYGPATAKEFQTLRKQLNASGLFDVQVEGVPWKEYRKAASDRKYEAYGMGWFPDFPDADNFIDPFFGKGNFLNSPYQNPEITGELIPQTRRSGERTAAEPEFIRAQKLIADEVPLLPLWQSKSYVAARDGITGVEWALNSSSVLQLWELERGARA